MSTVIGIIIIIVVAIFLGWSYKNKKITSSEDSREDSIEE